MLVLYQIKFNSPKPPKLRSFFLLKKSNSKRDLRCDKISKLNDEVNNFPPFRVGEKKIVSSHGDWACRTQGWSKNFSFQFSSSVTERSRSQSREKENYFLHLWQSLSKPTCQRHIIKITVFHNFISSILLKFVRNQ